MKKLFTVIVVCLLLIASTAFFVSLVHETENQKTDADCLVGVAFCGNTTTEAKLLIDRVKDYTNLFVLQSGPVSENETATNEICDYAVDAGLDLIVFFGDLDPQTLQMKNELFNKDFRWRVSWVNYGLNSGGATNSLEYTIMTSPEENGLIMTVGALLLNVHLMLQITGKR